MWPAKFFQIDKKYLEEKILSYYSRLSYKKEDYQKTKQNLENLKEKRKLSPNMTGLVGYLIRAFDNDEEFYERKVHVYFELACYHHLNRDHPDIIRKVLKRGAQDYLQFIKNCKNVDKLSLSTQSWLAAVFCCFGSNDMQTLEDIFDQYKHIHTKKMVNKPFLIQMLYSKNLEIVKEQIGIYYKSHRMGFPQDRREIMQGIAENDPSIFMDGVRKIHTRFTTMWTMSRYSKKGFNDPNEIVDELINYRWGFSEWAIIGLCLAKMYSLDLNYDKIPETFIPKYLYTE